MRQNIEPITQSNLANVAPDHLKKEIEFYEKANSGNLATEQTALVLTALKVERDFRKNDFSCDDLKMSDGICSNNKVAQELGCKRCARLDGKTCLVKQLELFSKM